MSRNNSGLPQAVQRAVAAAQRALHEQKAQQWRQEPNPVFAAILKEAADTEDAEGAGGEAAASSSDAEDLAATIAEPDLPSDDEPGVMFRAQHDDDLGMDKDGEGVADDDESVDDAAPANPVKRARKQAAPAKRRRQK